MVGQPERNCISYLAPRTVMDATTAANMLNLLADRIYAWRGELLVSRYPMESRGLRLQVPGIMLKFLPLSPPEMMAMLMLMLLERRTMLLQRRCYWINSQLLKIIECCCCC